MDQFFENDYIRIYDRTDLRAVMAIWKSQPGGDDYRQGFTRSFHAVKAFNPINYHPDIQIRDSSGRLTMNEWKTVLMPKVIAEGLSEKTHRQK